MRISFRKFSQFEFTCQGSFRFHPESNHAHEEWLLEVNVNSANASELSLLPGVGPVLARRIVSDRLVNGRFDRIVDLQRVRGIGPGKLAEIREMAVVDP